MKLQLIVQTKVVIPCVNIWKGSEAAKILFQQVVLQN